MSDLDGAYLCTRGSKSPTPEDLAIVADFARFLRGDTTEKENPMTEPTLTPVEYTTGVVTERLKLLSDQAGLSLVDQVDARAWGLDIGTTITDHGFTPPEDLAERNPGDVHREAQPDYREQAIAYNGLMWRLAVAMGLAEEGDGIVDVDLDLLANDVVTLVQETKAAEAGMKAGQA